MFGVPNFAKAVAQLAMEATKGSVRDHALDIGCSVGRSAFELATQFKAVDALDFSADLFKWVLDAAHGTDSL